MSRTRIDWKAALIVVDVQNDFCPGGALPVPRGDQVVPTLNRYIKKFSRLKVPVVFTRDWHPSNHMSFKPYGGTWPPHCVQHTKGAELHPKLQLPKDAPIISKGDDEKREAYSGFEGTDLAPRLRAWGVTTLFVGGLATDYCVKNTVLDGLKHGFQVYFLEDASLGVEVQAGDSERAIHAMISQGAKKTKFAELT